MVSDLVSDIVQVLLMLTEWKEEEKLLSYNKISKVISNNASFNPALNNNIMIATNSYAYNVLSTLSIISCFSFQ